MVLNLTFYNFVDLLEFVRFCFSFVSIWWNMLSPIKNETKIDVKFFLATVLEENYVCRSNVEILVLEVFGKKC